MNYITLNPEAFFDENGYPSMEYLSQYCQLPTTKKFIYDGNLNCLDNTYLKFPNIIKTNIIHTKNFADQFPDLEEVDGIYCIESGIPNIGKLKSVDSFQMYFDSIRPMHFIKKYIKIIDENTVIINGQKLNVRNDWRIDVVANFNYKEIGL